MKKEKLIQQYKQRIEKMYDPLIEGIVDNMKALRGNDDYANSEEWRELQTDRKIKTAEKQCYVQFISDLEWELYDDQDTEKLKNNIVSEVDSAMYSVNNPSAWDEFSQEGSDKLYSSLRAIKKLLR
jgi:hypothetical protein